jgi:uncharacterized alkaline shock family protein YloU
VTAVDLTAELPARVHRIPPARPEALATPKGETVVAPAVVATVARCAAGEVDGVEVVDSSGLRGLLGRSAGASADVASRQTAIDLRLAVCWPQPIPDVVERVRQHVRARVQELTGYEVSDVDIVVGSLPVPSKPARRVV